MALNSKLVQMFRLDSRSKFTPICKDWDVFLYGKKLMVILVNDDVQFYYLTQKLKQFLSVYTRRIENDLL